MRIAGVVLAGGNSRRFGRDKALEHFRGVPLIDWSLAALDRHAEQVFVSGRHHSGREVVFDRPAGGLGPLAGLAGALQAASAVNYSHLLTLPCDTPLVPEGLLAALCERSDGAFLQACPVIGIWPTQLGSDLERHIAAGGDRSVQAWATRESLKPVSGFCSIPNINYESDLAKLDDKNS
jgi:molybdopterin-guanine dinucleotide biosynthesis protein A